MNLKPCPSSLETGLFEWEDIAAMGIYFTRILVYTYTYISY